MNLNNKSFKTNFSDNYQPYNEPSKLISNQNQFIQNSIPYQYGLNMNLNVNYNQNPQQFNHLSNNKDHKIQNYENYIYNLINFQILMHSTKQNYVGQNSLNTLSLLSNISLPILDIKFCDINKLNLILNDQKFKNFIKFFLSSLLDLKYDLEKEIIPLIEFYINNYDSRKECISINEFSVEINTMLFQLYKKTTNINLFLKQVETNIKIKENTLLTTVLNSFDEISTFGIVISYALNTEFVLTHYNVTLSSFKFNLNDSDSKTVYNSLNFNLKATKERILVNTIISQKLDGLVIELYSKSPFVSLVYNEKNSFYNRKCFTSLKNKLNEELNFGKTIEALSLLENSWVSFYYNPSKNYAFKLQQTSFLVYYSFTKNINKILTINGLLPVKMHNISWCHNINGTFLI